MDKLDTQFLDESRECNIDHCDCKEKEEPLKLACGHVFGNLCLRRWLEKHNTCCLCRQKLFESPEEDKEEDVHLGTYTMADDADDPLYLDTDDLEDSDGDVDGSSTFMGELNGHQYSRETMHQIGATHELNDIENNDAEVDNAYLRS